MVTQRPLEALFMVRVHAGQPALAYPPGVGLANGNANVAETDGVGDVEAPGEAAGLGDGVGVGLGGGGIIFSQ